MISFATSNKRKFESAQEKLKPLGVQIKWAKLDIIEPQEESIQKVAKYKVAQAFKILQKPVVVSDAGISIPALKGFPGPFMHYITIWLKVDDLINLTKDKKDRTIVFEGVMAYKDSEHIRIFSAKRKGILLKKPKGKGIPLDQIVTFRKDKKTIAECESIGISRFDRKLKDTIWTQFAIWYKSRMQNEK